MTQKKFKARVFFGENLSHAMSDGNSKRAKELLAHGDGNYVERVFSTEAEREAYFTGMADIDGWLGVFALEDSQRTPKWVKEYV